MISSMRQYKKVKKTTELARALVSNIKNTNEWHNKAFIGNIMHFSTKNLETKNVSQV
jgi:hypothetical protein